MLKKKISVPGKDEEGGSPSIEGPQRSFAAVPPGSPGAKHEYSSPAGPSAAGFPGGQSSSALPNPQENSGNPGPPGTSDAPSRYPHLSS